MAVYNDYDGVAFTVQDLRIRFPHLIDDIVVVDNDPPTGERVKRLCQDASVNYVPYAEKRGSAAAKQRAVEAAKNEWVLLIDSHVLLIDAMGIERIMQHEDPENLYHGALSLDNLDRAYVEMEPVWRGLMWGIWGDAATIKKFDAWKSKEIWGHGMGLALFHKDFWPNFHPDMEGFGGEEGYIHEKYRKQGGKVISFPDMGWWHRFHNQSAPTRFPNLLHERMRNYYIGFKDLGNTEQWEACKAHFKAHCSPHNYAAIRAQLVKHGIKI
jgi:glycosyltransferase involved in cell wall biosynthesis